jgi:hypothetical protein
MAEEPISLDIFSYVSRLIAWSRWVTEVLWWPSHHAATSLAGAVVGPRGGVASCRGKHAHC